MTYLSYFMAEMTLLLKRKQDILNALLFFIMVIVLFPLAVDPGSDFLSGAASGVIWCATALSFLMAVEGMFREDYMDGALEQLLVTGLSLPVLALLKVVAYWCVLIVPLLVITPVLSDMLYLPKESLWVLISTLLLGTPAFLLMGGIGAVLTLTLKRGSALIALLVLPFYLPVIVFSSSAIQAGQSGLPYMGLLAILLAISLLSLVVSPILMAVLIRASVS